MMVETPHEPLKFSSLHSSELQHCALRADMPSAASPSPAGGWQNKLVREHTLALVQRGMVPAANPDPWRPLRLDVARAHAGACVAGAPLLAHLARPSRCKRMMASSDALLAAARAAGSKLKYQGWTRRARSRTPSSGSLCLWTKWRACLRMSV